MINDSFRRAGAPSESSAVYTLCILSHARGGPEGWVSTRSFLVPGHYVAGKYREKASGARVDRPELLGSLNSGAPVRKPSGCIGLVGLCTAKMHSQVEDRQIALLFLLVGHMV